MDVRQLFRQARDQKQSNGASSRASLPQFAIRTSSGQLMCTLCQTIVKKDALWSAHQVSRKHADALASSSGLKTEIASDAFGQESDAQDTSALPQGFFDAPPASTSAEAVQNDEANSAKKGSSLPADFFDNEREGERVSSILKAKELKTGLDAAAAVDVAEGLLNSKASESQLNDDFDKEYEAFKASLDLDTDLQAEQDVPRSEELPGIVKSYSVVSDDEGGVAISLLGDEELQSDRRIQRLAELKRKRATLGTKPAPSASAKKVRNDTRALNIADDNGSDVEDNFGYWT